MTNRHLPTFDHLPAREEIIKRIIDHWPLERKTEVIPVTEGLGRIPAADVFSQVTLPVLRASAGDGIAVNSACFSQGPPDTGNWVLGVDYARADTGDDFCDSFDAVIMIEDVSFAADGGLTIREGVAVKPGSCVRPAGSTVRAGQRLVQANLPLRPRDLAGLQMGGVQEITVWKKPVTAFIPSGSELIPPGAPLSRGKNIDTNSLLVSKTLEQLGAEPLCFPIVPDAYEPLKQALLTALAQADIVLINGGSSKGDEDCTATLLHENGRVLCHGSQAVPGKPLCAAIIQGKPVINLPGPFMAAYHGLEWCVNNLVSHYLQQPPRARQLLQATLTKEVRGSDMVSILLVVEVERKKDGSGYWATPMSFKDIPLARTIAANGQYMTKLDEYIPAGGEIQVQLLRSLAQIPQADY